MHPSRTFDTKISELTYWLLRIYLTTDFRFVETPALIKCISLVKICIAFHIFDYGIFLRASQDELIGSLLPLPLHQLLLPPNKQEICKEVRPYFVFRKEKGEFMLSHEFKVAK